MQNELNLKKILTHAFVHAVVDRFGSTPSSVQHLCTADCTEPSRAGSRDDLWRRARAFANPTYKSKEIELVFGGARSPQKTKEAENSKACAEEARYLLRHKERNHPPPLLRGSVTSTEGLGKTSPVQRKRGNVPSCRAQCSTASHQHPFGC